MNKNRDIKKINAIKKINEKIIMTIIKDNDHFNEVTEL